MKFRKKRNFKRKYSTHKKHGKRLRKYGVSRGGIRL
ncbi:MAG: hypothetical protein Ta2B_10610 [Termitinemataceae bacterium]|nr:MAG: hypothetical protein Ta2B_10610 [Termitinemataceae bacterium]